MVVKEKTKQEEIREGIAQRLFLLTHPFREIEEDDLYRKWKNDVDDILAYLHSQGVVLKVEKNTTDFIVCPCDNCTAELKLIDEWGYFCDLACGKRSYWIARCRGHEDMAGYVATESLVEE